MSGNSLLDYFSGDTSDISDVDLDIITTPNIQLDRIYDIVGQKFGRLTVLSFEGRITTGKKKPSAKKLYKVKCDCGKELLIVRSNLVGGEKKSCGCRRIELIKANNIVKRQSDIEANWGFLYNIHIRSASERGYITELTLEEFKSISIQDCYYCGAIPVDKKIMRFHRGIFANGIDRINNDLDYIFTNCRPCCTVCDRMKLNNTEEKFFEKIKAIYNKHFKDINI